MGRKLLTICYDGSNYHGWQVQKNGISVQQTLQDALQKMLTVRPGISGCSRTDSGVHAYEFCCHFDTDCSIPNRGIILGLNMVLPKDISALNCEDVADDFHSRYNSKGKNYLYKIYENEIRNPFYNGYILQSRWKLDVDKMNRFASDLIGTHDFAGFTSAARYTESTVRTVTESKWYYDRDVLTFSITADGFLFNMVRIIVGSMLYVSAGRINSESAPLILETKNRKLAGPTAPGFGLYLNKVFY